jgi:hypothetical protein
MHSSEETQALVRNDSRETGMVGEVGPQPLLELRGPVLPAVYIIDRHARQLCHACCWESRRRYHRQVRVHQNPTCTSQRFNIRTVNEGPLATNPAAPLVWMS